MRTLLSEGTQIFDEGIALYQKNTPESYRTALEKFKRAAPLFAQSGEIQQQAILVVFIVLVDEKPGSELEVLNNFNDALTIFRKLGDKCSGLQS